MDSFTVSTRPYNGDGFDGYDRRRFDSGVDSPSIFDAPAPYENGDTFFSPERNGGGFDGGFGRSNGPILAEILPEVGSALMEWRRENAIRLAEKEVEEKEMVQQIREEAEEYKAEFYSKRKIVCETHKTSNREKEKLFLETREKFHSEAEKNYWKAIAELIPREVPAIEKRGKKKKPSIAVVQGPKPGKPTDPSRMRQILGKLKHNPPTHMIPKQPELEKDAKVGSSSSKPAAMVAATPAPVAVA